MDVRKQKEKTEQSKLTFARNLKRYMEMKGVKTGDVARALDHPGSFLCKKSRNNL